MSTTRTSLEDNTTGVKGRLEHPGSLRQILVGVTGALLCTGVVMVASASSIYSFVNTGNTWSIAEKQLMFAVLGIFAMRWASRLSEVRMRQIASVSIYGVLVALAAVLVIGVSVYGQKNWIAVGPFRLQPSEFAKLAMILWCADHFTKKDGKLHYRSELLYGYGIMSVVILGLVLLEGDLGTAMVMMPIIASMLFFVGAPMKWFGYLTAACLAGIVFLSVITPYRMARFASWLNPSADEQGTGFQVIHGQRALGSGGWFGVGLGASKEKWGTLPEAHTDFIYAVIGEEGGIVSTLLILVLFAAIVYVGLRIARTSPSRFVQLTSLGIVVWIATQVMVNIGAVLGILPVTGVPLPLVSYGGSSLIPTLTALGILLAFTKWHAQEAQQ